MAEVSCVSRLPRNDVSIGIFAKDLGLTVTVKCRC